MAQQEEPLDIYIWWDLESVKFERSFDPLRSYAAITSAMATFGFSGNIVFIKAYAVKGTFPNKITSRLAKGGVEFIPLTIPEGIVQKGSQRVDLEIKKDLRQWKQNAPMPPAVTVIMSCDKGYLDPLEDLRQEGFTTCMIYAEGTCTSKRVAEEPMHSLRWFKDVLNKAPLVDPKLFGLTIYGPEINFEVAPSLISLHPFDHFVAVTVSWDLRVFNLIEIDQVNLVDESGGGVHDDSIRAICYGTSGKLFVSGGNDKRIKIWSAETWHCLYTLRSTRGVTAVAIRSDDSHVCYTDKLGHVFVIELDGIYEGNVLPAKELYHDSRIITSLDFSPDDRYIISADGNYKIRVTSFPKKPLQENNEIKSFYLEHEKLNRFITCVAFVWNSEFLLSGSGDSTVRLWDITSMSLLEALDIREMLKAGDLESNESEQVTMNICTTPESSLAAVNIQSFQGIVLLSCDKSARSLAIKKVIPFSGESFIPTSISLSKSAKNLWMVSGASNPASLNHPGYSRVRVISCIEAEEPSILGDEQIPGGIKLLEKLQGKVPVEDNEIMSAATEVARAVMDVFSKKKENEKKNVISSSKQRKNTKKGLASCESSNDGATTSDPK